MGEAARRSTVGTVSDGSEFGRTMVRAFRQSLPGARLARAEPSMTSLFYGGTPDDAPARSRARSRRHVHAPP